MKHKLWFSSIGCSRDKEKPLLRLDSLSLKTNMYPMLMKTRLRSRKSSRQHSPSMMQWCRLELPLPCLIKTRRTPQDSINIFSPSPSSLSTPESLTLMLCWSGSSITSTPRSLSKLLSVELPGPLPPWRNSTPRPQKSKGVIAASPPSGGDLSHCMEEVAITITPIPWT